MIEVAGVISWIAGRVSNGAALLDEHKPGWALGIDEDIFDIRNGSSCAVGQSFGGDYKWGIETLGLPWTGGTSACIHANKGFQVDPRYLVAFDLWVYGGDHNEVMRSCEVEALLLDAAWKVEIARRLDRHFETEFGVPEDAVSRVPALSV